MEGRETTTLWYLYLTIALYFNITYIYIKGTRYSRSKNAIPNDHTSANEDKKKKRSLARSMAFKPSLGFRSVRMFREGRTTVCSELFVGPVLVWNDFDFGVSTQQRVKSQRST